MTKKAQVKKKPTKQKREYKIFPYYGTKVKAVDLIWQLTPDSVNHLIEPFAGSLAVSLYRPKSITKVLVNDYNALIVNFWRAVRAEPEAVLAAARRPTSDLDMWAAEFTTKAWAAKELPRMAVDLDRYDVRMAGLWLYGQCNYLTNNFGVNKGPWYAIHDEDGIPAMTKIEVVGEAGDTGIRAKVPDLKRDMGIRANIPGLMSDMGIRAQVPELKRDKGIRAQVPDLKRDRGEDPWAPTMRKIAKNIEHFRILCGDWARVLTKGVVNECERSIKKTLVYLDPPYDDTLSSGGGQDYVGMGEVGAISKDVREWCKTQTLNGSNMVIILSGRKTEHDELLAIPGWVKHGWSANGGYGKNGDHDTEQLWCFNTRALAAPIQTDPSSEDQPHA